MMIVILCLETFVKSKSIVMLYHMRTETHNLLQLITCHYNEGKWGISKEWGASII